MSVPVLIYGSREFGQVVRGLVEDCGRRFEGFVDDWNSGPQVLGSFVEVTNRYPPEGFEIALAIGYRHLAARWELYQRVKAAGYRVSTLVHPQAYLARSATVLEGAMVMARAVVDMAATVGNLAVIWPGVVINHDSRVGENSFVSPNATVCGHSSVGCSCFVGAAAVVVDHVVVPDGSFIRAGAVYSRSQANGEPR